MSKCLAMFCDDCLVRPGMILGILGLHPEVEFKRKKQDPSPGIGQPGNHCSFCGIRTRAYLTEVWEAI